VFTARYELNLYVYCGLVLVLEFSICITNNYSVRTAQGAVYFYYKDQLMSALRFMGPIRQMIG